MKILPTIFGGSLALAVVLLGGVPAASASTSAPAAGEEIDIQACWEDVITKDSACAPTQEELAVKVYVEYGVEFVDQDIPEALVLSSDEKATLTNNERSAPSTPSTNAVNAVNATYILGIYYTGAGYTGSSETLTASLSSEPCSFYGNYVYGNKPAIGNFNDNIESFRGYGMCGLTLYADSYYGGSSYGPSGAASNLGAFANQASSIRVYKVS